MIIRAGVNIYPADVEAVLNAHPAVRDSAVVGLASPVLGEEVAAAVVLAADIGEPELIDWCRPRLAAYKVPARIVVVAELAKTSAGKVDKAAVRRMIGDPTRDGSELPLPRPDRGLEIGLRDDAPEAEGDRRQRGLVAGGIEIGDRLARHEHADVALRRVAHGGLDAH